MYIYWVTPSGMQFHVKGTKVKLQISLYRTGQALWTQEVEAPRISIQLAHEHGKVISLMLQLPLPTRRDIWYSHLLQAESNPGP